LCWKYACKLTDATCVSTPKRFSSFFPCSTSHFLSTKNKQTNKMRKRKWSKTKVINE
jgi:hypothetical protein